MRLKAAIHILCAAAIITVLAGCAGAGAVAPGLDIAQNHSHMLERTPARLFNILAGNPNTRQNVKSFYSCPASGSIEYVSDLKNSVITVYNGKLAKQRPCAQLTLGVHNPNGLYVDAATHDLYVANEGGLNVLVYHRGQTIPYNTYSDPEAQLPVDVALASDGTVVASNFFNPGFTGGSISTWIPGPNGGRFVGNFAMSSFGVGEFIAADTKGALYYNNQNANGVGGSLWTVSCPAGACGAQRQVSGVAFSFPAGMQFDSSGDLIAVNADVNKSNSTLETFELPDPNPVTFPLTPGGWPWGMAINRADDHVFVTDADHNDASEYLYPSGKLVGYVFGNLSGEAAGVAVDR